MVEMALAEPKTMLVDAGDQADRFDPSIQKFLPGVTVLSIPLIPAEGEMIGVVVLYRKGEQPFIDADVTLAEMIAPATAAAVRRND